MVVATPASNRSLDTRLRLRSRRPPPRRRRDQRRPRSRPARAAAAAPRRAPAARASARRSRSPRPGAAPRSARRQRGRRRRACQLTLTPTSHDVLEACAGAGRCADWASRSRTPADADVRPPAAALASTRASTPRRAAMSARARDARRALRRRASGFSPSSLGGRSSGVGRRRSGWCRARRSGGADRGSVVSMRPRPRSSSSSCRGPLRPRRVTSLGGSRPASTRLRTSTSERSAVASPASSTRTASRAVTSAQ